MTGHKVRWRVLEDGFEVLGRGPIWQDGGGGWVAAAEVIEPASLTELHKAASRARRELGGDEFIFHIFDAPLEQLQIDDEAFFYRPVALQITESYTLLELFFPLDPEAPRQNEHEVGAILWHLLRQSRSRIAGFSAENDLTATIYRMEVEVYVRGRTVGDVLRLGSDLLALWEASAGEGLTPDTVADLVRAQRPELLLGQAENEWLEVKSRGYDLKDRLSELELAKDVSALANRADGGLLIVGVSSTTRGGRDVLNKVTLQPVKELAAQRYRQRLDRLIYPRMRDVVVETVETEPDLGLLLIRVPAQPEALWPFLVLGAVEGGHELGNYFGLFRRRDDHTVVDTAEMVHGLMVAGRAALAMSPRWPLQPDHAHDRPPTT